MDYGKANSYDFDNPQKWVTHPNVPILDEHVMKDEKGQPLVQIDRAALEEIAANNNRRIYETGDPATIIVGHTSDDPDADEKPVKGFAVNYRVKPHRRLKNGRIVYALYADFKVRPQNAHLLEEYPRRSVELWWNRKEIDPIAILGGTSPERDLGLVIRNARINHVDLSPKNVSVPSSQRTVSSINKNDEHVIYFSRRGNYIVERYTMDSRFPFSRGSFMNPKKYLSDGYKTDDDLPPEDVSNESPENKEDTTQDPAVAKLLESKPFRELADKVEMIMGVLEELINSLEQAGPPAGGPPAGGPPGGPPPEGPPEEQMREAPPQEKKESRTAQGKKPIQFEAAPGASTGSPGPTSTYQPNFGEKQKSSPLINYSRKSAMKKDPYIEKLESTVKELQLKFARSEAANKIAQLKSEGILFGDTPQDAAEGEADEIEFLAHMTPEEQDYHINHVIRKRYKRQKPVPGLSNVPGVARYARNGLGGENLEEFEPETTEEAATYADLVAVKKLSRIDAAKECMRLRRERNQNV